MKTRLSLFCIALALVAASVAEAQRPLVGGGFARSAFANVGGDLHRGQGGWPGRVWFEANYADDGLGFTGAYGTIGTKTRLFEDRFDGRWLFEGQFNHSFKEGGGAFANIGIERVFSIESAGADVATSVWYDYDGDEQGNFAHTFHQVGVSGSIKTRDWDLLGNGYIPVGVQNYSSGLDNCFVGNNIVILPGMDSALQGFDATLRIRPNHLARVNGRIDLGGYHYSSDTVEAFGGARVRFGMQGDRGLVFNFELNHDERFDTTGVVGLGLVFGANASGHGHEYSVAGRDLEQTTRNDHIVRYNQEFVLAIDPDTGAPYNVVHVDNTADVTIAEGTAELPFTSLLAAQNNSAPGDIILVNGGDGTDRLYDRGIRLQDNQRLYGTGTSLLIPIQGGVLFPLCTDPTDVTPTISNAGGFAVVQLANNNDVGGINIDGTGARFGIFGEMIDSGSIRDNTIANASEDGVRIIDGTGDWSFARNNVADNGENGIFMLDATDPSSIITFEENIVTGNGLDGIQLKNFDPATFSMVDNVTDNNLRNGVLLQDFVNTSGAGLTILRHNSDGNAGHGIMVNGGNGNLDILNSNAQNNLEGGILIRNWATLDTERIFVGTTVGGVSTLSGNGAPANLQFVYDIDGIHANAVVSGMTLSDGLRGVGAIARGVTGGGMRTMLDIDIIDNIEVNRNLNDGIRLVANDGALITANIGNMDPTSPLEIFDNASGSGNGIALIAEGINGIDPAEIRATIDNVTIQNAVSRIINPTGPDLIIPTSGIFVNSVENSLVNIGIEDSVIGNTVSPLDRDTQIGIEIDLDNNGSNLINQVAINRVTLFNDFGIFMTTGTRTYADFSLTNSTILPNGIPGVGGRSDNTPFGDGVGSTGVFIQANGQGMLSGQLNTSPFFGYDLPLDYGFTEVVFDGVIDNLTRVSLVNNTVQDFTLDGVNISTTGDAHMLVELTSNRIQNNGAGFNDDTDNNNVFGEDAGDGVGVADPDNLYFFDGINIDAFDQSVLSVRANNNIFVDNFERGLSLNTFSSATINALVTNNTFFGNDRGEDVDNNSAPEGTGVFAGFTGAIPESGFADFEAVNNEEFYTRLYESSILLNAAGQASDFAGNQLPADTPGIFFPGNAGVDIFGNPVAFGVANMNLSMSSNALQLGPDILDFSVAPGDFLLGLDGTTNGFTNVFGVTDAAFPLADGLIGAEEAFFASEGF